MGLAERFWVKVIKTASCWYWTGCRHRSYGLIKVDGRALRAHRVAWALTYGPIPDGMDVLHTCDNPPCVNPAHLFLGTQRINNEDRKSKGRYVAPTGESNGRARLTAAQVCEIRARVTSGESKKHLAKGIRSGANYDPASRSLAELGSRPMRPCLVLSHALAARNWIASGMLDKMTRAGLFGTVLMPAALAVEYGQQIPFGWDLMPLEPWIAGWWQTKALEALRLGMLVSGARRGGLNYRMKVQAKRRPLGAAEMLAWRVLSAMTDPLPVVRGLGRAIPAPRTPFPAGCTHLILPTMIHDDAQQAGIVRAARLAKAPILAIPAGFDNLVTKGAFLEQPDRLAVWGAASYRHAVEAQGFCPGQVTITGPPHFWPYSASARVPKLVMPNNRHVVFAGTTVNYAADELQVIVALGDRLAGHIDTKDIAILYRPHPRRTFTLGQWDSLKGHRIVMDPKWGGSYPPRSGWSARADEIPWIRTITEGALCTISAFSTVVLESALVGTPSILIGFGDSTSGHAVLDHSQYEHMAEMMDKPGVKLATHLYHVVELIRACGRGDRPKPDRLRAWALELAAVDTDPREDLITWIKGAA